MYKISINELWSCFGTGSFKNNLLYNSINFGCLIYVLLVLLNFILHKIVCYFS